MESQDQQHLNLVVGKCAQPGAMALFSQVASSCLEFGMAWVRTWVVWPQYFLFGCRLLLKIDSAKNLQDEAGKPVKRCWLPCLSKQGAGPWFSQLDLVLGLANANA